MAVANSSSTSPKAFIERKTIYLAGPINGCTDEEASEWRKVAKARLAHRYDILDPMARDYRGIEAESVNEIVDGDKADIRNCNVLLVNANRATWGTSMEVLYAHTVAGKPVVAFCAGIVSPWLRYHAHTVVKTIDEAIAVLEGPTW